MASVDDSMGLRLLSLDGGGTNGLSSLLVIEAIMYRIKVVHHLDSVPLPCQYFHLIGGTNTGGLIALMLGRLRMSVDDAIKAYSSLAEGVFSEKKWFFQDGKFKASRLEAAIKQIVSDQSESKDPEEPMRDPDVMCRTFVCTQNARYTGSGTVKFRTYDTPNGPVSQCAVWEAACATSAAPRFFKRLEIPGGRLSDSYIDGGMRRNNPTDILVEEAREIFPGQPVACVLSIGTGPAKTFANTRPSLFQWLTPLDTTEAIDCENTHQKMEEHFRGTPGVYFRFNVDRGMQNSKLGEWGRLAEVSAYTRAYLESSYVHQRLDEVVQRLNGISVAAMDEIR